PFKIMLVGLFGNGKTTTTAKLAKFYAKRGFRVAMLSTDTWRPAAFVQLQQLGKQIDVPVFGDPQQKDPLAIYASFQKQLQPFDIVLVDTAGRDALNEELTAEITTLRQGIDAQEVFLVMSGDMGQSAQSQAEVFHQTCKVSGIIITKLDGTAKGGGALAACAVTGAPVRFIGLGEKVDALEEFKPKNFVGRLLGMGDLEALLEKTQEAFTQTEALDLSKRLLKGEFTLIDMYEQMESVKKMGPLTKVMELIPGFSQAQIPKEALKVQESKMKTWRYIMDSCTQYELEEPETISGSRVERIALGSGCADTEVRELIKQYKQAKKMVKMFKGGGSEKKMQQTMKQMMGKMKGGGFKF
ncbi:MAG: signal recognition particle protein Srp19, partial [Candidatus Woesearchaeota archaeon]